jgi:general secretion pathway protein D
MNLSKPGRIPLLFLAVIAVCFLQIMDGGVNAERSLLNAAPQKNAQKVKKPEKEKKFALNFRDVDISEFINIMGQLIGKNIIIDDRVKGKISISSARKVPISEAYNVMKAILEVKGLAVVETENLIKVLPIEEAVKKNADIVVDGKTIRESIRDEHSITYILELKNADANEAANALRSLKPKTAEIVVYPSLNLLILTGLASDVNALVKIAQSIDNKYSQEEKKFQGKGMINVVHLENANAEDLANVLSRIPFSETARIETSPMPVNQPAPLQMRPSDRARRVTRQYGVEAQKQTKLSIIADKASNSLIVTAKPEEFSEIYRIIKELDIVRDQVLIEAMIVEVSADNGWGFGVEWMLGTQKGKNIFGGSYIDDLSKLNFKTPDYAGTKKLAVPLNTGFQLGYVPDIDVLGFAVLNASATDSNFNILSTPQVLTVDNSEAELNVGEEISVPTNNRITDQNTTFQTFEYKTVGIKLKITPHITKKKRITLDLYQEANTIIGQTQQLSGGAIVPPTVGKRDIKTKVTVYDGMTIVVGGLIQNRKNVDETKVPILGDIPLLGWLFKHKSVTYSKSNLLVFITPHIMTKRETLESISKQKMETQKGLRKQ